MISQTVESERLKGAKGRGGMLRRSCCEDNIKRTIKNVPYVLETGGGGIPTFLFTMKLIYRTRHKISKNRVEKNRNCISVLLVQMAEARWKVSYYP